MRLFALVGKSGTGKSFHAISLTKKFNIEAIIDDGLFIYNSMVIEGISAKKQATKIGAIKTAIFFDEDHRRKVMKAIDKKNPESILIIGTSDEMIEKIATRLDLVGEGKPSVSDIKRIYIEEITTAEERAFAYEERHTYGKHVIPAPGLQLKRTFAGYFMDPLRLFRGRDLGQAAERTVVRPPFSYLGEYYVDTTVIDDIIVCAAKTVPGISKIYKQTHYANPESYKVEIAIRVKYGYPIWETAMALQKEVNDMIEYMTAFNVTAVNVEVRDVQ